MKYKYIANSIHKNHMCDVLKWSRGKAKAYCHNCDTIFMGVARCFRKDIKSQIKGGIE